MVLSEAVPLASLVVKNETKQKVIFLLLFQTCLTAIAVVPSFVNIFVIHLKNIILGTADEVNVYILLGAIVFKELF